MACTESNRGKRPKLMYVRGGISFWHLFHDSWRFLVLIILWSVLIVYLHEIRGYTFIAIPMAPRQMVGADDLPEPLEPVDGVLY